MLYKTFFKHLSTYRGYINITGCLLYKIKKKKYPQSTHKICSQSASPLVPSIF